MGEIADAMIDQMIFGGFSGRPRKRKTFQSGSGDYKWKTAGGKILDMRDMELRHLRNTLALCERTGNTGKAEQLREVIAEHDQEWNIFP